MENTPLVAHIILRLDVGGLENGLVNLINNMPAGCCRHAVICLRDYTDFRHRISNRNVAVFALNKREGKDLMMYARLWKLLRRLRPDIVHTRNLAALDSVISAVAAGVPYRVHSEHGWDMHDLHGTNRKYILIRRACRPFIHRYIAVSRHLEEWLIKEARIPAHKLVQIYNGVDTRKFFPAEKTNSSRKTADTDSSASVVIGTVGRMERVKDQLTLVRAFITLCKDNAGNRARLRLMLVGDGPLRGEAEEMLRNAGLADRASLTGSRSDVDNLLREIDIFVLPSLNEGISNTILEAMASGLPVIATNVGGNGELVVEGETGCLVAASDPAGLAEALQVYVDDPARMYRHGQAGRQRVEALFSLDGMVRAYTQVYSTLLRDGQDAA